VRTPIGNSGGYVMRGEDSNYTIFHRRIRRYQENPNHPAAKVIELDCGHAYMVISVPNDTLPERVFCTVCKDLAN
jgi:hypothetical protein